METQNANDDWFSSRYGRELRNIVVTELTGKDFPTELMNSNEHGKLLNRIKMHPSYQDLLTKLKDKIRQILCALDKEDLDKMMHMLRGSSEETSDEWFSNLGDVLSVANRVKSGTPFLEWDSDDEEDTSSSRDSSLTLRAQSPMERQSSSHTKTKISTIGTGQPHQYSAVSNQRQPADSDINSSDSKTQRGQQSRHPPHPSNYHHHHHNQHHQQQQQQQNSQSHPRQSLSKRPPLQISQSFSDAESSFSSCFNQSGFTVLNQDELVNLAAALDRNRSPLVNRQQALRHLVHLPIIDIQACEAWSTHGVTLENPSDNGIESSVIHIGQEMENSVGSSSQTTYENRKEKKYWADRSSSPKNRSHDSDTRQSPTLPLRGGDLRTGLADALNDPDETLWSLALRYIGKGLSTTPPNILETYSLLMEHLTCQFKNCGRKLPLIRDGIDISRQPINRLVRACHLMDQFHRTITHYWIRNSEKFLNEIITRCVNVLSIGCPELVDGVPTGTELPTRLIPLHLLSLIDPQACWFNKWMHGTYSRIPLLDRLKENRKLVSLIVSILNRFLRKSSKPHQSSVHVDSNKATSLEYTQPELDYALFVNSLNMFYHLLCYSAGRKLFASLNIGLSATSNSISALIGMMAAYLQHQNPSEQITGSGSTPFNMTALCLMELAKHPQCSAYCFVQDPMQVNHRSTEGVNPLQILITGFLDLFPVKPTSSNKSLDSVWTAKAVAYTNILRNLASHNQGRTMLHQYGTIFDSNESLIDRLQRIVRNALKSYNNSTSTRHSAEVITALIDLCGLLNALPANDSLPNVVPVYNLVVETWKTLMTESNTNAEHQNRKAVLLQRQDLTDWQLILKRNLVQLAESPLGVMVLEYANLLDECATILHTAHQVRVKCHWVRSHYWGLMLTQMESRVASTRALRKTGLVRCLILDAWKAVEFPNGPTPSADGMELQASCQCPASLATISPPNWPIDPIDNCAYKPFINLVKLTSSFESVAYFLTHEVGENPSCATVQSPMPESLWQFLDRSLIICSEDKMRALYNLEQTHTFALRLLSCIVSDLDSMLLLCTRLDLLRVLIQLQLDTFAPNAQGHTSLDALVLERNYLLVKCYFCGGPTERCLPLRFLCEHGTNPYPHPVITRPPNIDDPVIHEYYMHPSRRKPHCDQFPCTSWYERLFVCPVPVDEKSPSTISRLLHALQSTSVLDDRLIQSKESAVKWIQQCRQTLDQLTIDGSIELDSSNENTDISILLQNCLLAREHATDLFEKPAFTRLTDACDLDALRSVELSPFEMFGVETAVRYGQRIGALAHDSLHPLTDSGHVAALTNLLKRVRCGLNRECIPSDVNPEQVCAPASNRESDVTDGFDWFTATIFLAFRGDANRAWDFLAQFASDSQSIYLWPRRAQTMRAKMDRRFKNSPLHMTGHFVDHILALECPNLYNTFVLAELPPSQITRRWMKQCFWNYLDWPGILEYIVLCLLHSEPFHIYFLVSIMRHLRQAVRLATAQSPTDQQQQPQQLVVFLQEEPIRGFESFQHLDFIRHVQAKYGKQLKQLLTQ